MIDKFRIFNKVKIDTDKYEEVKTNNDEELKIKMKERLNSSKRVKERKKRNYKIMGSIASVVIIVMGLGIANPSLANNLIKRLPQFETMLDKIKEYIDDRDVVKNDSKLYEEREEEKKEYEKSKLIATPINVSSKSEGLEITIDKAMYDKKKIYLDMTLKTDELFKKSKYMKLISDSPYGDNIKQMSINDLKLFINGVEPYTYTWGAGIVDFIDEHTINLSYLIELDPENDIEDANFKIGFSMYKGKWSFDFNIKSIDDNIKTIKLNEKDGDYTLKKVDVATTYIELEMELPFQPSLENPHNNFIIVKDDKGRELNMSAGTEGKNKIYTQINELIGIGEIPKYIDILVCESYEEEANPLSSFKVNLE